MAQLTFFNPDTGEKLGEAKGTVRWDNPQADPVQQLIDMQERMMKRDEQPKVFTAEGQATVHISRRKNLPGTCPLAGGCQLHLEDSL